MRTRILRDGAGAEIRVHACERPDLKAVAWAEHRAPGKPVKSSEERLYVSTDAAISHHVTILEAQGWQLVEEIQPAPVPAPPVPTPAPWEPAYAAMSRARDAERARTAAYLERAREDRERQRAERARSRARERAMRFDFDASSIPVPPPGQEER